MAGNQTVTVKEADGTTETDLEILGMGRQAVAASKSVGLSTEDKAVLDAVAASLVTIDGRVDGLETLVTSTNTKLDTAITALQIIDNMVLAAGTANIGDVDVLTLPTDPVGANADAASATGSISAKLRAIATALGVTAFDLGVGTGGSRTLRVALDTGQLSGSEYEAVAASQTDAVIGGAGATGDYMSGVLVIPATTTPGVVTIKDNTTAIISFPGGAASVSNLVPFFIPVGVKSVNGAWKITTGANVSVLAVGDFT